MTATPSLDTLLATGPFHLALRTAIRQRGLTLERLRSHLARRDITIGLSTLSYWQQGTARPNSRRALQVIAALEEVLGLPHRTLLDLLEHTGPTGWPKEFPTGLPGFNANDLEVVARQDKVFLDAKRHSVLTRSRIITRARFDSVDRFFVHYYGDNSIPIERFTVTPRQHCRLGRVVRRPGDMAVVFELLFDHVLSTGDTWIFEFDAQHSPNSQPCHEYWQGVRGSAEHSLIEVQFHPYALPTDIHVACQDGPDDEPRRAADLTLNGDNSVHHLETALKVSWIGIRWSWPD
ncbi:helix-turn-helix transcriptional regulator [Lentzea tibetensis]|uniref:Helix-turn-helix transcriptional regulator n=1 Tax=Lentzea tibetensis TaxID=2591470 RepID=A0A563EHN9_9PSEU|nr:helix-turn-helix transcriptional regulator [Lentzea tibetensis]TWP45751.1 helix-turn-helix transcriptional regulator [Lentzea tibetensis]